MNFSYFDKPFFEGMFGDFCFPDGTKPDWESLNWIQKEFMQWFNKERLKAIMAFPIESFALIYKNGKFIDNESAKFVAEEYARGHSFFTYISDTVDSLSSCCFTKDTKILAKTSHGIHWDTFENINKITNKSNFTVFHNGSWCNGRIIKLPNRKMLKVITSNGKEIIVSDNHLNPTLRGDIRTDQLTTEDYLLFNTNKLDTYPEVDEHLTYEQGLTVGTFLGGIKLDSPDTKNLDFVKYWTKWHKDTNHDNKELNMECLLQSYEFRLGILDGWSHANIESNDSGYTTSKKLADCMEVLITSLGKNSVITNISDKYPLYCIKWSDFKNNEFKKITSIVGLDTDWKNNSVYFKIRSIEEVPYKDDIYCVEMKNENEPYFTLPNGIITHNCRLKNMITTKEFSFTNGNLGVKWALYILNC